MFRCAVAFCHSYSFACLQLLACVLCQLSLVASQDVLFWVSGSDIVICIRCVVASPYRSVPFQSAVPGAFGIAIIAACELTLLFFNGRASLLVIFV